MIKEYQFTDIYTLLSLVDRAVDYGEEFWNFDEEYFINSSTNFSKDTLLHQYIVITAFNYHLGYFRKNSDLVDEETLKYWLSLFEDYKVNPPSLKIEESEEWLEKNTNEFINLFDCMADEAFQILFLNRNFLIKFNQLVTETVKSIKYPSESLTNKETIKRKSIPQWVKNSIYHRDKGRCVFCNTDLTGLVNTLTSKNFDHIVPLDLYGVNDPCNIQLTCERCNKSKSNREASTSSKYQSWW